MITCKYAIAAKGVIRDSETNNISIYNVYDDIHPKSFPVLFQNLAFLAILNRDQGDLAEISLKLNIVINGDVLFSNKVDAKFGEMLATRVLFNINGLVIQKPGLLTFILSDVTDVTLCKYSINVTATHSKIQLSDSSDVENK